MLGFVNGLAIVIGLAQIQSFKVIDPETGKKVFLPQDELITMGVLAAVTMAIIYGFGKLTKAVPAPLAGIGIVAIAGWRHRYRNAVGVVDDGLVEIRYT